MCRLAAFPPGYPRERALEILLRFEGANTDGVGAAYVKDGKFKIEKSPMAISEVLDSGHPFLSHMPNSESWTIAHLRLASHGCNHMKNTHPFIVGDWCMVHNGIWSNYATAKLALKKFRKFEGDTDSEVAAHMLDILGPEEFVQEIDHSGVFLGLRREGDLWVCKTSGDLEVFKRKNDTIVMASTLDRDKFKNKSEPRPGWYHYDKEGKYIDGKEKEIRGYSNYGYGRNNWRDDYDYDQFPSSRHGGGTMCSYPKQSAAGGTSSSTAASTPPATPENPPKYTPMSLQEIEEYLEQGWRTTRD